MNLWNDSRKKFNKYNGHDSAHTRFCEIDESIKLYWGEYGQIIIAQTVDRINGKIPFFSFIVPVWMIQKAAHFCQSKSFTMRNGKPMYCPSVHPEENNKFPLIEW